MDKRPSWVLAHLILEQPSRWNVSGLEEDQAAEDQAWVQYREYQIRHQ